MISINSSLLGSKPSNQPIFPKANTKIYQRCICFLWGWSILSGKYGLIEKIILGFMIRSIMFWGRWFIKRGNLIDLSLLDLCEKYASFLCLVLLDLSLNELSILFPHLRYQWKLNYLYFTTSRRCCRQF